MTRQFQMTDTMTRAAALLKSLADLKTVDAELFKTATTDRQRNAVRRAASRRRTLKRALGRWLSDETRAQRGQLPIGDWEDRRLPSPFGVGASPSDALVFTVPRTPPVQPAWREESIVAAGAPVAFAAEEQAVQPGSEPHRLP